MSTIWCRDAMMDLRDLAVKIYFDHPELIEGYPSPVSGSVPDSILKESGAWELAEEEWEELTVDFCQSSADFE